MDAGLNRSILHERRAEVERDDGMQQFRNLGLVAVARIVRIPASRQESSTLCGSMRQPARSVVDPATCMVSWKQFRRLFFPRQDA